MKKSFLLILLLSAIFINCNKEQKTSSSEIEKIDDIQTHTKTIDSNLPIIGLLSYNGVLTTEITAPMDVFTKNDNKNQKLFNVIVIAENNDPIITEEGLKIIPDFQFQNSPLLDVLFVPSAYDMSAQVNNSRIINFIKKQNQNAKYVVSNCAGAQLIGKSGIADGHKIVTWIGGGIDLQKDYPNLLVQNDSTVTFVEDGKFSSSNGNLATYISSLNLLEKMTNSEHKKYVESYIYLERLQKWR